MDKALFSNVSNIIVSSNRIIYTASAFARLSLMNLHEIGELKALQPHKSSRSNLQSYLFFQFYQDQKLLFMMVMNINLTRIQVCL